MNQKHSLTQIVNGLNKEVKYTLDPDSANVYADNSISEMDNLKAEAKRLFDEVNSYVEEFCNPYANTSCQYMSKKVLEEYLLKQRIKTLQQKMNECRMSAKLHPASFSKQQRN